MGRRRSSGGSGAGIGAIGLLVLLGMCIGGNSPAETGVSYSALNAVAAVPSAPQTETFYAHGTLNVRSGPGKEHSIVRTVSHGDVLRLGPKDAKGWAPSYTPAGTAEGYLYRASDLVKSNQPSARASTSASAPRRSSAESRGYYRGPRGGCYTYSASGRKRYVDRSLCD